MVGRGGGVCSTNGTFVPQIRDTWCEQSAARSTGVPSLAVIERSIAGTWFSTGANGRCEPHEVPSRRPGGCRWKTRSTILKNYSCVNTNMARAVRAANMSCFAGCPDGHVVYPGPMVASDCWQTCFFGAILGLPFDNTVSPHPVAPLISAEELEAAWVAAIEDDVLCPPLPSTEPPLPPSLRKPA